jgi:BirA family biotin operon repressor/biotin-[acetyl-CoA-carboxylase] ligase
VALPAPLRRRILSQGQAAADLAQRLATPPQRNTLVSALLDQGINAMQQFAKDGLAPFLAEYAAADALRNRAVTLQGAHVAFSAGLARGCDSHGALLVEHGGTIHRIIAGEVSVRPGGA